MIKPDIRFILWGDSGVGKSNLLMKYATDKFNPCFISTIGIDFKTKDVVFEDKKYKLQIWDTGGNPHFRTITTSYLRGPMIALLCFSIDDKKSFTNLEEHISYIQNQRDEKGKYKIFIVSTKIDDETQRKVTKEDIAKFLSKYKFAYYEVSAKTGENVDTLFNDAIMYELNPSKFQEKHQNVVMLKKENPKSNTKSFFSFFG
jgi:Ras-related protein Rab-8A